MVEASPMAVDPEAAAQRFYAGAAPAMTPDVPGPQPSVTALEAPAVAARAQQPEATPRSQEDIAHSMYGVVQAPTQGMVDWDEPVAQPADYRLEGPPNLMDMTPEGQAAMERMREAFAAAGAGRSLATELFGDAVRAHQGAYRPQSLETTARELRAALGSKADEHMAAARALIQRASQKSPELVPFLERTGLGNNTAFILKVVKAAGRRV